MVVCDTNSYFSTSTTIATGPPNDAPQLRPVMARSSLVTTWNRLLVDATFDVEVHHRYYWAELQEWLTIIPLNHRVRAACGLKTKFRRQMVKLFRKKPYDFRHRQVLSQRWQAESAFSRQK